ncbi:VOC family protein [Halopseudomonas nanhaiensis]|uniref:VOC family protein n=1 Tax=Halopseudomonas nanhaiensis TaxID=2830842 RepID=UPI001CBE0D89|nr:VOC family protein [Halopseudomonas nanhaiensis]UAW99283.1 VOC family protein [Halopseudomonas nanhaiensis]
MEFAKAFFDIGVFTNQREAQQVFWAERAGLPFDHTQKLGGGVLQHRYQADAAILKLNDARDALADIGPGPIREILVASPDAPEPISLSDPDGNRVTLVPCGHQNIQGLAARLVVSDPLRSRTFYRDAIGMTELSDDRLHCGLGQLWLEPGGTADPDQPLAARGIRYLTFQVFDCDTAFAHAVAAGAMPAREPVTLGSTARIAFVKDPDGTWIELSQRASVTGKAV